IIPIIPGSLVYFFMNIALWSSAAISKRIQFIGQFGGVGGYGTPFPGGQMFGKLKAKTADIPDTTCLFSVPLATVLMGTVFDHKKAVFFGKGHNGVHIGKGAI